MHRLALPMVLAAAALTACQPGEQLNAPDAQDNLGTGAKISVNLVPETDVVGFHFEIDQVSCETGDLIKDKVVEANVNLLDQLLPGGIDLLEFGPLDPTSEHLAADLFVTLEPGCYTVMAAPASECGPDHWKPSADCTVASTAEPVEVVGGETTEIVLLSQCEGVEVGALDVVVVLNTPPVLDLELEKFGGECEPREVCVQAWDLEDDPVEITLENLSDMPLDIDAGDQTIIGFENGYRIWEQCFTVVPEEIGSYELRATVYDLALNEEGEFVRFEDLTGEDSSIKLDFPIHSGFVDDPLCVRNNGKLRLIPGEPVTPRAPMCHVTSAEDYYCSGDFDVAGGIEDFVCDGDELIPEALYPLCRDVIGH